MEIEPRNSRNGWQRVPPPVLQASLWLRFGFVAASVAAAALAALVDGDTPPLTAIVWALVATLLGGYSFRRSWTLLDRGDSQPVEQAERRPIARAIN